MNVDVMSGDIRAILASSGRLAVPVETLSDDADLFAAGIDSLAIVNVLMSIEEAFDIEFPEHLLSRKSFSSIGNLSRAVAELRGEQALQ
jgi:acyl carrier protein